MDYDSLEVIRGFDDDMALASELENRNEVTLLLPFMYGALLSKSKLDIMYELAMERADVLLEF